MTTKSEVYDRDGKRVTRPNGILQDGDMARVPMRMMDAVDPGLAAATALADAVRRNEQFDARGHRPGFIGKPDDTSARDAYFTRANDAWKSPPALDDKTKNVIKDANLDPQTSPTEDLKAARDRAVSDRDARTQAAWKAA
jgi:hypothetical protein